MPRTYTITYDIVTPESAEDGDTADHGFGVPGTGTATSLPLHVYTLPDAERRAAIAAAADAATGTIEPDEYDLEEHDGDESAAAVALAIDLIRRHYGATEYSCSCFDFDPGGWYTTPDGSTDYRTGEVTTISVHLDGWTDDELRAIHAGVTRRR